ncbi:hypothetical protein VTO42DRAFT_7536 [Malbranchea cinnamomea]
MDGTQGSSTTSTTTTTTSSGNSSDFVRKLYKMLEDPSYSQIVRWGDARDSFVVLECEKFTKTILPKHFKHSNFASFVRQLNKYDFHKVRHNNEEGGQSPYGPNAWEFKHPEFKANNKDSLDNIKRKAPAPRKPAQSSEDAVSAQQFELMNQQIVAQQQQIQHLSERFAQLGVDQQLMLQEVRRAQKTILNHEQVIHCLLNYLHSVDSRLKRGAVAGGSDVGPSQVTNVNDEPSTPLQQATKLLNEMNSEIQFNLNALESISDMQNRIPGSVPTTTAVDQSQRNGIVRPATSAGSSSTLTYSKLTGNEMEPIVYPVGTTNGIDPMFGEHVNNIPYSLPQKELDSSDHRRQYMDARKKRMYTNPGWIRAPRILLVEDDQTCRQIGGKFLQSFCCMVETALDGLEAVNKTSEGPKYDLILMDIIMPNLDGVSACSIIRRTDPTPIIAMTSNIRSSDIDLYFQHGMNDVLAKPFTRQSLLAILEKHLVHLKAMQAIDASQTGAVGVMPQSSAAQSVKDENSPGQSPGTAMNNWQSPGTFQGLSPLNPNVANQFMHPANATPTASFTLDQNGGVQFAPAPTQIGVMNATTGRPQHRRQVSEMSSAADVNPFSKRPRVFASASTNSVPVVNPMQTNRLS